MRLGGWLRLGIVLSIVWALGAALHQRNGDLTAAQAMRNIAFETCIKDPANALGKCANDAQEFYDMVLDGSWSKVATRSLAPIPLAWLLVCILAWSWRWVRVGFNKS